MKKIKYEKPKILDAGPVASIRGANCYAGPNATGRCVIGDYPETIHICESTGNTTEGNCLPFGTTAQQFCNAGTTAGIGCYSGGKVG